MGDYTNPKDAYADKVKALISMDLDKALFLADEFLEEYPESPVALLLKAHIISKLRPHSPEIKKMLDIAILHAFSRNDLNEIFAVFNEMGLYHKSRLEMVEAINYFYLSIEYMKGFNEFRALVHFNLATSLLAIGDYIHGFDQYKWLYIQRDTYLRHFKQPFWRGEVMKDKTVYVHNEQAFGDLIFFFRFIRKLKPYFKKIILEVPGRMIKFIESSNLLDKQFQVYKRIDGPNPGIHFDVHTHFALLPHHFKTVIETIPVKEVIPYFSTKDTLIKKWKRYFAKYSDKIKIAINYCGKPTNEHEHARKVPLEKFVQLASNDVQLFSIQKFYGADQMKDSYPIIDLGPELDLKDAFLDTAAVMEHIDLVITSDTSIAHLAGSLDKNVCVLLPFNPEWRWLLDTDKSVWYTDKMKLFRQKRPYDWDPVFEELTTFLNKKAVSPRP